MALQLNTSLLMAALAPFLVAVAGFILLGFAIRGPTRLGKPVDALLVFGSSVPWRAHSRYTHAAALFQSGKAGEIVVSGGAKIPWRDISEAEWLRERLVQSGIPAARIVLETESGSTLENVARTRPIVEERGYRSVAIVTSEYLGFHVRYLVARIWKGLDVRVHGAHARASDHWNPWTWWISREGWRLTRESIERYRRAKKILDAPEFTQTSIR